ncbi:sensor histidine kinase [Herbaspirillum sp. SJZ107]|uniref:sensor histidine kinase n=1 Tax=Herbaspirillum sp. SJZ107 TaxID=2572881 RepID=UPI00116BCFDC|nr:histidine kinase [Herbaspirillum sp. SJZ107]TQK08067.1 histidine kinase [Herbaspirillum sp. SJZ107]
MAHDFRMPTLHRKLVFALAWILFWTMMTWVAVQDFIRGGHAGQLWKPVLWEGSSALVCTLLALVQLRLSRGDARLLGTPLRWFARQALFLPMYWIAFVPLAFGLRHGVYGLAGETYTHDALPQLFLYESIKISIFVGLFTAVRFGVESYRALLEQKLHAERANALLRQAQLQRLAQQMQPHFLFNALNTISSLMHSDVDKADATLLRLAEVLRATLDLGQHDQAPFGDELRLARGYAGVMAERFAGRVEIDWDVDAAVDALPVPVMSLQPLLENVFKHTVERRRGLTRIVVSARREADRLVLRVDDDGGRLDGTAGSAAPDAVPAPAQGARPGSGTATGGIGLANLRARLAAMYGGQAAFDLSSRPGGGVRVELRLPCGS